MSETMLRVALKDLGTIRVKCRGTHPGPNNKSVPCEMTYEVNTAKIGDVFEDNQCPRCRQNYLNPAGGEDGLPANPLKSIANGIEALRKMAGQLEIEFDVPLVR